MNDTAQDKKNELRQMMHERGAIDADDNLTDAGRNYLYLLNSQLEKQRYALGLARQSLNKIIDMIELYQAYDGDEYKNWIPSAAERAARPSLGICQGCGRWLDYRTETCTCWNDRHVTKRVISQDEALIAMRAILKLTESSEAEQVE